MSREPTLTVKVQEADVDPAQLQSALLVDDAGAVVTFTGYVKAGPAGTDPVSAIELEHYPGMTERSIETIMVEAARRWPVMAVTVVHRVGRLEAGEQIVWVGASSVHRGDAFAACEFVMDYLKTRAPFWKKEYAASGERWVDARDTDTARAARWRTPPE